MADQKVERDLPAELQIFFHPPAWALDQIFKKANFGQTLEIRNSANIL